MHERSERGRVGAGTGTENFRRWAGSYLALVPGSIFCHIKAPTLWLAPPCNLPAQIATSFKPRVQVCLNPSCESTLKFAQTLSTDFRASMLCNNISIHMRQQYVGVGAQVVPSSTHARPIYITLNLPT